MKKVVLMDCTLRDGANVVGRVFSGNHGYGVRWPDCMPCANHRIWKCRRHRRIWGSQFGGGDGWETYLEIAKNIWTGGSELGMFLNAKRDTVKKNVTLAKEAVYPS